MKRKNLLKQIFTAFLGFVVIIATTGIHLSIHTCRMAEIDPEIECETCSSEDIFNTNNCENEPNEYAVKIASQMNPCCTFKNISKKVDDKFVSVKAEEKLIPSLKILYPQILVLPDESNFISKNILHINSSPPFLIDDKKHITNSVLLI